MIDRVGHRSTGRLGKYLNPSPGTWVLSGTGRAGFPAAAEGLFYAKTAVLQVACLFPSPR